MKNRRLAALFAVLAAACGVLTALGIRADVWTWWLPCGLTALALIGASAVAARS